MSQTPKPDDDNEQKVVIPDTLATGARLATAEEVRQGHTGDHVRRILAVSIAGAAIALALAYFLLFR
jgi:hypothetical protein